MKFVLPLFAVCSFLLIIFLSIKISYSNAYFYYHESGKYLVNYITNKPFIEKIFDYRKHDAELYRPRELGNLFNWLDAELLVWFAKANLVNFLSPLHFIAVLLISVLPVYILFFLKKEKVYVLGLAIILGLIYLSSPAPFFTTYYFRTSKIVESLLLSIFFWSIFQEYASQFKLKKLRIIYLVSLVVAMCTVDEIGIMLNILSLIYFAVLYLYAKIIKKRFNVSTLISIFIGLLLTFIYRRFIGPSITAYVVGSYPLAWGATSLSPELIKQVLFGVDLLFAYMGYLIGGIQGLIVLFLIYLVNFILIFTFPVKNIFNIIKYLLYALIITAIIVIFLGFGLSMMIINLPALIEEGSKFTYYPLPFVTLWFLMLSAAIYKLVKHYPKSSVFFYMILPTILVINLLKIPEYNNILKNWWRFQSYYDAAKPLIAAINDPNFDVSKSNLIPGGEIIPEFKLRLVRKN